MSGMITKTMQYIETLYLNAPEGDIAKPEYSDCVRFCGSTVYAHATIIYLLSNVMNKAQLLWQEGTIKGPYYVSIIFPFDLDEKRKPEDAETTYERIKWYINNFRVPDCGLVVSFYKNTDIKPWITTPWHLNEVWPMKRRWSPKGTHITIQSTENLIGSSLKSLIHTVTPQFVEHAEKMAKKYGYQVKFIDYTLPYDEMYEAIVTSDHHFTYCGATYYFAATVGCPTTSWGYEYSSKIRVNGAYFTYKDGKRVHTSMQLSRWSNISTNRAKIMQYDSDEGAVLNKPLIYCSNVDDVQEIDLVFKNIISKK